MVILSEVSASAEKRAETIPYGSSPDPEYSGSGRSARYLRHLSFSIFSGSRGYGNDIVHTLMKIKDKCNR